MGGGPCGARRSGCGPWRSSLRVGVSDKVSPPVDGGHPDAVPSGGRAFAVGAGEQGALVSGDVEKGVEEELDALAGGVEEGARQDAFGGARGVEAQHLLVSETLEVLPYGFGVVEGVGFGRCGGRWRGVWRGGWCGRGGLVVVAACGVW